MRFSTHRFLLCAAVLLYNVITMVSSSGLVSDSNKQIIRTVSGSRSDTKIDLGYHDDEKSGRNVGLHTAHYHRPIQDFEVSNILLASDVEGSLHALNRETGEVLWCLDLDAPLVQVSTNSSNSTSGSDIKWMVEPYGDGNLYFFNRELGLNRLPVTISQLVLQSPFALNSDDKIYTGIRKSSLYSINLRTGEVISSFGSGLDNECKPNQVDKQNDVMLVGKTTYELTIHSRNDIYWNVTYSTWGPNNIDVDLAYQNKYPLDGTYIAPFHDNTLLAIDINSKIAKWVSKLPSTVVNVFDVLKDYRSDDLFTKSKNYLIIPHPLKNPDTMDEAGDLGTYLDQTKNHSWYAMSSEYYPSLVKSAPTSRYSLSERWRSEHSLNSPELFDAAITGVHLPNENNQRDLYSTSELIGYPSDLQRHHHPKSNDIDSYNPPPRSDWLGLPSSSSPILQIDPSPADNSKFLSSVFGKFLYRCLENLIMVLVTVSIIYAFIRLQWIPSIDVMLKNNGLELKELSINQNIRTNDSTDTETVEEEKIKKNEVTLEDKKHSIKSEEVRKVDQEDYEINEMVKKKETKDEVKKEVKIVEPPEEDRFSPEKRRRRRGARGGRKNKKSNLEPNEDKAKLEIVKSELQDSGLPNMTNNNENESLSGLTLSDSILGYGSYGTVVFKGVFQNRDVAIKRMLIDFYDVASHEINLLTESDDHPNVIRYFYSETNNRFLYIALELCSASLEDVIDKTEKFPELIKLMDPVNVLEQVAKGLHHLHSLKIVHRDIKPQNILVAQPKKLRVKSNQEEYHPVRILISDFGLCKKLEADESSFRATTQHAAGTSGWRAPELLVDETNTTYNSCSISSEHSFNTSTNSIVEPLVFDTLSKRKLTRAIDIFSLGCVFYYILTNGSHPFGDRYMREGNVIKDEYSLEALDILPDNIIEAKDLISKMIKRNPKLRPNTAQVLSHPFFWNNAKKLEFLLKVSDRFEVESRDPPSELLMALESIASDVIGNDWCSRFDKSFLENLGKYRKYHPDRIMDLLRALRNKYHHFNDLPRDLSIKMSPLPNGFYNYFIKKFPNLFMEIYHVVEINLYDDAVLKSFFVGRD